MLYYGPSIFFVWCTTTIGQDVPDGVYDLIGFGQIWTDLLRIISTQWVHFQDLRHGNNIYTLPGYIHLSHLRVFRSALYWSQLEHVMYKRVGNIIYDIIRVLYITIYMRLVRLKWRKFIELELVQIAFNKHSTLRLSQVENPSN